ncbi:TetR family transcriptional regulator [Streptosporangium lutulentum]|uniref:AcrR family transcriptional regulator n=1 Tax=Streptosporangium lutulentum TaxID=1461250 RepID=A0ABT9QQD0_9ACTN|nr:TetR family transcriptional regulator [Streptosporangium lutulentum]MDP9848965.1 AcrR family transcriptional regulator [Streptosporangium lutulentum]
MSSPPRAEGLRERKKAKTRGAIQEHALLLFVRQGYEATTVEQIAEAAEVSPSTFFRYFPAKEDVVTRDEYGSLLAALFREVPPGTPLIDAFRQAVRTAFDGFAPAEFEKVSIRARLVLSVPALHAGQFRSAVGTHGTICAEVASRTGRDAGDPAVQTFAAAVVGVMIPAIVRWAGDPSQNLPELVDTALARLAAGLPL